MQAIVAILIGFGAGLTTMILVSLYKFVLEVWSR